MAGVTYFKIPYGDVGAFGLSLVDRDAVGYSESWQAPGGKVLPTVVLADYDTGSTSWQCQVTASALTATANITTNDRAGTLCVPPSQSTTVGTSTFQIELGYFQDINSSTGLSAYLLEFETKEAYVYFGADADDPPRVIGRVRLTSGNIGGDTHVDGLTAEATFPFMRKPDVEAGIQGASRIILGTPATPATGATAGTPGTWTPAGSTPPANAAAATSSGVVASPATAWTTGQYVQGSTAGVGGEMYWSGSAWTAGRKT